VPPDVCASRAVTAGAGKLALRPTLITPTQSDQWLVGLFKCHDSRLAAARCWNAPASCASPTSPTRSAMRPGGINQLQRRPTGAPAARRDGNNVFYRVADLCG
jgi:hypothetical protein